MPIWRGTESSNPLPSRKESANHRFLSPHACARRRRGQGEPFGAFQCGYQPGAAVHGRLLIEFSEAALGEDEEALKHARAALKAAIGPTGLVDAAAVLWVGTASLAINRASQRWLPDWGTGLRCR